MGAEAFRTKAQGATAQAAFEEAQSTARYDHGHAGYTGTIAEKNGFEMIPLPPVPADVDPMTHAITEADKLISAGDERIDDKWGPAGCFDVGGGNYLFFGWASC